MKNTESFELYENRENGMLTDAERTPDTKNKVVGGTLYLVATPIGNLADMSARALKVLSEVDFIAAEDTRNSHKLLSFFGISKPMVSYFEHNKAEKGEYILKRLQQGESCALITDAGTPAISDPGEDMVRLCAQNNVPVTSVPGCCAAITALSLSALPTGRFAFEGFLSGSKSEKRARLEELSSEKRTLILYEAPHRLCETLDSLLEIFGDRRITLCRELTKLNEEIIRTTVKGAVELYKSVSPRGEYVLVIDKADNDQDKAFWKDMSVAEHVDYYVKLGNEKMAAIKLVAKDRGVGKNAIYKELLDNKG